MLGIYPMLLDETCYFLAADFDKQNWREDMAAVLETCRQMDIPSALEQSRSGHGGHLWLFFQDTIPAPMARSLGAHILTETMERRPDIGLDSYDRLFPNQDTLPKGGFGNLIALPLQKKARACGNSVFLDENGIPHADQWAFLSSIRRIGRGEIERIVHAAEKRNRIVGHLFTLDAEEEDAPWTLPPSRIRKAPPITGPLPKTLELTMGNEIYIAKNAMPPALRNGLLRLAAFQNPEFYKAQAMRLPTRSKPRVISCAEDYPLHIGLPRGCFDECHHISAPSFEQMVRQAKAKYITGLSATVTRKDGHHPILFMQCGPIRHRVDAKRQAATRPFTHSVLVRPTSFRSKEAPSQDARIQFSALYDELSADENRNRLICDDVRNAVREGRSPVVLTERTDHLQKLAVLLTPALRNLIVLQGKMGRKKLKEALARLADIPENEERVLLATGRFIGEGFDDARLDSLFLALPVSWRGTIAQYAGRLHRLHDCKKEVRIYDYADLNVPMLARMFDRRCLGYEAIGYSILLPASAVPGWPAEVPLPVEPEWKKDYAASIQRLIRDGVDALLGNLFVHATRAPQRDAQGEDRARSATEAFLYRRLETLFATRGKFRLNAELPIPFNEQGRMEVDLLCAEKRLAIELDGPQHLSDPGAYRRDRSKDALLQEHGYFVLRFLAEDVGRHLDTVLDTILRTMAHQEKEPPAST